MTLRAIIGLAVLNLSLLGVGAGVLWGLRGWRWWTDFVRLAGVAYLLGVASLMALLTLELVLGVPFEPATIVASGIVLVASGLVLGRLRGRDRPWLRPRGWRPPPLSLFSAMFVAGTLVYLEAVFRAGRLARLVDEYDGWAFWVPKAKAIYFFGGLEPDALPALPGASASYPPGLPALHAMAFHAMGSADVATFHLQYSFLAVGFVAALAGLLAPRVRQEILLPLLVLMLVMPHFVHRVASSYADVPLGYLVAVAALLVLLWVEERQVWQLAAATLLLAGAMLTKREGILLAACVVLAAFAASWRERRLLWPRLAGAALVAFALSLPWRVWFTVHGLPSDAPDAGYLGAFGYLERVWPSVELVTTTLFDPDLWFIVPTLASAAAVLAFLAGARRAAVFAVAFLGAGVVAGAWAIWSNPVLPFTQTDALNPVVRLMGTPALVLAALTPLLLERAWSGARHEHGSFAPPVSPGPDALVSRSALPWAIVLLAAAAYPASMLVGYSSYTLPGDLPRFPSTSECVEAPVQGETVRVVLGYADSYPEANRLRDRALAAGLQETEVAQDGCGRLRVFLGDVPSLAVAEGNAREARAAALDPTLENDPRG